MEEFQKLIDFQNLFTSYKASLKGKGKKKSSAKFSIMTLENLYLIKKQLIEHTYKISPYNEFVVHEPKRELLNRVLSEIKFYNIAYAIMCYYPR